jgi:hypothetical protein
MKILRILVLNVSIAVTLTGFSLAAYAQVYRSTDADGNVTFSDQPTPEGKEVKVPETNVGDSVKVPPPAPEPVVEPEPEIKFEELPAELQGGLEGVEIKSRKRTRPRKQPKSSGG